MSKAPAPTVRRTPRTGPGARRGFTMYEVIVAVGLVMTVLVLVVPRLNGGDRRGDEQARFTASTVADAQVTYRTEHARWAERGDLADRLRRITLTSDAQTSSTAPDVASMGLSGPAATDSTLVGIAVEGTARCWMVRLSVTGTLWATKPANGTCRASSAMALVEDPDDKSLGTSPDRPIRSPRYGGSGQDPGSVTSTTTTSTPTSTTTSQVPFQVFPPTPVSGTHGVDSTVDGVAVLGSTVYLGGNFTQVLDASGTKLADRLYVAAFDLTTGSFRPAFTADANGQVYAVAASGSTVYLAGKFSTVNGQVRRGFAAVDATSGALLPWTLDTNTGGNGRSLKVSGQHLYVGGTFSQVAGVTRTNTAKVSLYSAQSPTATVDGSYAPAPNGSVRGIDVTDDGATVYLAGAFTSVGTTSRTYGAAVSASTGALVPVSFTLPDLTTDVDVDAGGSKVAFGVAGAAGAGNFARQFSTLTGSTIWTQECAGDVQDVYQYGTSTYIAFHDACAGYANADALELHATTGTLNTAWTPSFTDRPSYGGAREIIVSGTTLLVVGDFVAVNGTTARGWVMFRI